ncbi:MAG TPA: hypothetical protein VMU80_11035 [Bryobacteraceae bacterium]|nr:hypothetical protein [Bryobacteraceae bacterium]
MLNDTSVKVAKIGRGSFAFGEYGDVSVAALQQISVCEGVIQLIKKALLHLTISMVDKVPYGFGFENLPGLGIKKP